MLFKVVSIFLVLSGAILLFCVADDELKAKFLLSCEEIKKVLNENPGTCEVVYEKFKKGFQGKENSELNEPTENTFDFKPFYADYFDLVGMTNFNIKDKALFWTGTQKLQQQVADKSKDVKCAHTILGMRIIDHLNSVQKVEQWCSHKDNSIDINKKCPAKTDKTTTPTAVFWAEASKNMARATEGIAFFMTRNAYVEETTYFRRFELPTLLLKESKCTTIIVINIVNEEKKGCEAKELQEIREMVVANQREYKCTSLAGDGENPSKFIKECVMELIASGGKQAVRCKLM